VNAAHHAIVDGLTEASGAIPNGPTFPRPTMPGQRTAKAAPVQTTRAGIGPWRCDSCRSAGTGWVQAEAHTGRTGHRRYAATDWQGLQ
jgi:hypothetical protein